jgi:hypothetical protein
MAKMNTMVIQPSISSPIESPENIRYLYVNK